MLIRATCNVATLLKIVVSDNKKRLCMFKKLIKFFYLIVLSLFFINPFYAAAAKKPTFKTEEEENLWLVQQYQAEEQANQKSAAALSNAGSACAPAPSKQTAAAQTVHSAGAARVAKQEFISGALLVQIPASVSQPLYAMAKAWYKIQTYVWNSSGKVAKDWFEDNSTLIKPSDYHITLLSFKVNATGKSETEKEKIRKAIKDSVDEAQAHWQNYLSLGISMRFSFAKYEILDGQSERPPHYFVATFTQKTSDKGGSDAIVNYMKGYQDSTRRKVLKILPDAQFPQYDFTPHISLVSMSPRIKPGTHIALPKDLMEALKTGKGNLTKQFYTKIKELKQKHTGIVDESEKRLTVDANALTFILDKNSSITVISVKG